MISAIILGALVIPILMALMISPTLSSCTTMAELNQTQAEVGRELIIEANELETRINKSGVILEITSKLPEVSSVPFASSIASELHRIPKDVDTQKEK